MVYDLKTKELLFQEPNANSVAWNTHNENMLCFTGNGLLNIKASNFPVHQQVMQGFVVGFSGSKIFCLHSHSISSVDVPQSAPMCQYLEKKMFLDAYQVACLGVTEGDWRALAMEALEGLDFEIAKKAFIRIRELRYLELVHNIEERKRRGETNNDIFLADVYSYEGKHQEAARLYKQAGYASKAMDMFSDLRQFEHAKEYLGTANVGNVQQLIKKQAEWCNTSNDPRAASEMYIYAGDFMKGIEIVGQNGWMEKLMEIARSLNKTQRDELALCAHYFKHHGHHIHAADIYTRMNDVKSLVDLHVEACHWEEAFSLVEEHPQFKDAIYMPYATWLAENDRFDEAQKAFHQAGRSGHASHVLEQLLQNAVNEKRFGDASYYYWVLAKQCLDNAHEQLQDRAFAQSMIDKFSDYHQKADIYHSYDAIQKYIDEPFTSHLPEALFHMARYLFHLLNRENELPAGVSKAKVLIALAKLGRNLGAYKVARHAFEKLQAMRILNSFQDTIDIGSVTIRSKPFHDQEELLPMCYRCSTTNPLINSQGNCCVNCQQPFVYSFFSFDILPLVMFTLEDDINDEEAIELIQMDPPAKKSKGRWQELQSEGVQTLQLSDGLDEEPENDLFGARLLNFEPGAADFVPVQVDRAILKSLYSSEVLIQKWPSPIRWTFYRNLMPDMTITVDPQSFKMFAAEDYELLVLQKKLPFTHSSQRLL
ncbi:intraflagellar transport protein 122 homolog [Corticium candelabrum]|uniref:intraflagellar transport protein 122 homolog n=1 Tax=Corticium candelabrum TaxID=121492 RepID=UPI002E27509C|nr:intraflagellar transport protein 122 homolog [Corticium candelabrum]